MSKQKPLVSICTLSYKKFEFIFGAIESVLKQDYENIEYIIADDGSDNFPKQEIIRFVEEKRSDNLCNFILIDRKENVGTVKNIKNAWEMANGEILIPLSADDVFCSTDVVSSIVKRMLESQADFMVCNRILCDEKLNRIDVIPRAYNLDIIKKIDTAKKQYKAFATGCYYEMASGSVFYMKKKTWTELGGFDESYRLWEDGPFFVNCTKNGYKIHTAYDINAILYRDGGVSSGKTNLYMLEDMKLLAKRNSVDIDNLTWFERRHNKMMYENLCAETKLQKSALLIKYIDVSINRMPMVLRKNGLAILKRINRLNKRKGITQ